jgi:hypothetical protein
VCVGGDEQVFRAALGDALVEQVAPGVLAVAVAPVLALAAEHRGRTVCIGNVPSVSGFGFFIFRNRVHTMRA